MSTKPSTAAALHGWDELLSDPPADLAPAARDRLPQLAEREVSRTKRVCPLPTPQRRARAVLLQEHGAGGVRSRAGSAGRPATGIPPAAGAGGPEARPRQ
ncbi:hypothetical protein ACWERW_27920 [Streptomyces sp. NPDC004012]